MRRTVFVSLAVLLAALMVVRVGVRSKAVAPGSRGDIAFASKPTSGGNYDIFAMTPSSGAVSPLVQTGANERAPAWNPDGTKLAFVRDVPTGSCASPCYQLFVWNTVTHATTPLTSIGTTTTQLFDATWSSDGTQIAFTRMDASTALQVYVVPANGSASPRRVTGTTVAESSPDWSPDDSTIVMSNGGNLYTIASSATSGTPTKLTLSGTVPAYVRDPTWGPDGRIAFVGGPSKFSMYALYVTNADGSNTSLLWNNGSGTLNSPAWAPDASRVTFALVPSGTDYDIGILNLCNGNVNYPAPAASAMDIDPNWQPVLPAPATIPPTCASPSPSPSASPSASSSTSTATTSTSTTTTSSSSTGTSTTSTASTTSTTSSSTSTSSATSTSTSSSSTSTTTSSPPPTPPSGTHVQVADSGFAPTSVRIARGGTIVWDNTGTVPRGASDATAMELWDTGLLPVGWPGWATLTAAGTYRYADPASTGHTAAVVIRVGAAPHRGHRRTRFVITWSSAAASAGYAYDVQIHRPGGRWRTWKHQVSRPSGGFQPDAGRGTYRFRSRLVKVGVDHAGWSPASSITVR